MNKPIQCTRKDYYSEDLWSEHVSKGQKSIINNHLHIYTWISVLCYFRIHEAKHAGILTSSLLQLTDMACPCLPPGSLYLSWHKPSAYLSCPEPGRCWRVKVLGSCSCLYPLLPAQHYVHSCTCTRGVCGQDLHTWYEEVFKAFQKSLYNVQTPCRVCLVPILSVTLSWKIEVM